MIARTTRTVFEIAAASLLGVMLLASVAAWRLAQGPVPLDFLTEHLESALNGHGAPFRISMAGTNLAWAGWQRTLDIRVVDVRATGANGAVIARVPEMSVSMSLGGLLRGVVAPRSLDLIGATVRLVRRKDGAFVFALGDSDEGAPDDAKSELFKRIIDVLGSSPVSGRPATYLRRLSVLDAQLVIDDQMAGVIWGAPRADIVLLREEGEIRGTFYAELDIGGSPTKINGAASWRPNSDIVRVETDLTGVPIDRVAAKLPGLKEVEKVRLDVDGQVVLDVSLGGTIKTARFDLTTGKGLLGISEVWPEDLPVTSGRLRGNFEEDTGRLEIEEFVVDAGGPRLSGRFSVIGVDTENTFDGRLSLNRISLPLLTRYWPRPVYPDVREWVVGNMADGIVEDARMAISFKMSGSGGNGVELEAMSGTLRLRDTEILYLKGLPPVRKVDANVVFARDRLAANVRRGTSEGLTVTSGTIRLKNLDKNNEHADFNLVVSGSLSDALALVDRPPLGFVSRFDLDPATVDGHAATRLVVSLPIDRNLGLKDISIAAASTLRDPRVPNMAFGQTLSAQALTLKVDKTRLELSGSAKIGDVPATINWVERFGEKVRYARSYEAKTVLNANQRSLIGLPDLGPYITGPVALDVAIQQPRKGPQEVAVKMALKDAELWLPKFNWRKKAGVDGVAWLSFVWGADGRLTVKDFNVRTPDLALGGTGRFDQNQKLVGLEIKNFSLKRTQFVGTIKTSPSGVYIVNLNGPTFDATPFLEDDKDEDETIHDIPPVDLHANFGRVWFEERPPVDNLAAHLIGDGSGWRKVDVTGVVGGKQELTFSYNDGKEDESILIQSDDAGEIFRVLGIVETMQGGELLVSVKKARNASAQPWNGSLQVTDFVLVDAPVMARILTSASLTGIDNTLSGRGISFARLDVPLQIKDGVATVKNARMVGSELGFTAEGVVNTKTEKIALSGTIVPVYTLNSLLGKIPLLGGLLTGKKGSGIFAATYRVDGPIKKPTVSVNPLAALAPGVLRNLLGIFDGTPQSEAPPASPPGGEQN